MKTPSQQSKQIVVDTPENWDAASSGYAEKVAPLLMEAFAHELIERLDVTSNVEALEVACGSGALTVSLARQVKTLLATDFSPKMLELAKHNVDQAGLSNVSFAMMDGQALELDDNSVDRAACSFGLMLFPDRHKGFSELQRVVRPGGKVVMSGWAEPDKFQGFSLFFEAINQSFPNLPKPEDPPVFTLSNLASFKAQMEAAGFKEVSTEYVAKDLILPHFNALWAMLTVGAPPVQMLFDKVGVQGKSKVHDALNQIIQERYGDGPITITNTATIGTGIAP